MSLANQRAAGNGGIALWIQTGQPWPAVPEHSRWASAGTCDETDATQSSDFHGSIAGGDVVHCAQIRIRPSESASTGSIPRVRGASFPSEQGSV
jgi:hypothetical protein